MISGDEDINNIISGCITNDRQAQEKLYKAYYRAMINLCLRYTKNNSDAVEVLNNGFLKVFKNIQRFDAAKATVYTWIRKIVINSCLDFIQAKQSLKRHHEIIEEQQIHIPAEIIQKMDATELLQLVRQLPPATRAVFNLFIVEGYSHKEIAALLTISEGTSKWHLSDARKQLQQMIQKQDVNIQ